MRGGSKGGAEGAASEREERQEREKRQLQTDGRTASRSGDTGDTNGGRVACARSRGPRADCEAGEEAAGGLRAHRSLPPEELFGSAAKLLSVVCALGAN